MLKWKMISALSACVGSIVMVACVVSRADQPATQPTNPAGQHQKEGKGGHGRPDWGFAPYNKLTDATDEQKMKINEIHKKFLADKKAIEDKQEADVTALLTDDQKVALEKMKADEKAKHKKDKAKDDDDKDKDNDKGK